MSETAAITFAGWVDPNDPDTGPERPDEKCFQIVITCPTPDAFDGLTLGDIWNATPVKIIRAKDTPNA